MCKDLLFDLPSNFFGPPSTPHSHTMQPCEGKTPSHNCAIVGPDLESVDELNSNSDFALYLKCGKKRISSMEIVSPTSSTKNTPRLCFFDINDVIETDSIFQRLQSIHSSSYPCQYENNVTFQPFSILIIFLVKL